MTNVLIGIIGVILFIGLALAGAFYLGPQFQRATYNSKAMSLTQMASQIAAASSLHRTETSVPIVARTPLANLQTDGYLRTLPLNPYIDQGGWPFRMLYSRDMESSVFFADVVLVSMGGSTDAREVCSAINRQTTGSNDVRELLIANGTDVSSLMTANAGCFRMHDVGVPGEANPHDYIVYAKI